MPIHIHAGDTAVVTFTGVGYDKRVLGDTMQLSADQMDMSGVPGEAKSFKFQYFFIFGYFLLFVPAWPNLSEKISNLDIRTWDL